MIYGIRQGTGTQVPLPSDTRFLRIVEVRASAVICEIGPTRDRVIVPRSVWPT